MFLRCRSELTSARYFRPSLADQHARADVTPVVIDRRRVGQFKFEHGGVLSSHVRKKTPSQQSIADRVLDLETTSGYRFQVADRCCPCRRRSAAIG